MNLRTLFTGMLMLMLSFAFGQEDAAFTPDLAEGEAIFKTKCMLCHKLDAKLIGPPLKGVTAKYSEEWLIRFIRNSTEMIESGDEDAVAIFNEYNQMPMLANPDLSDDQIRNILAYIDPPTVEETAAEDGASTDAVAAETVDEAAEEAVEEDQAKRRSMDWPPAVTWIVLGLLLIVMVLLLYLTTTLNSIIRDRK